MFVNKYNNYKSNKLFGLVLAVGLMYFLICLFVTMHKDISLIYNVGPRMKIVRQVVPPARNLVLGLSMLQPVRGECLSGY